MGEPTAVTIRRPEGQEVLQVDENWIDKAVRYVAPKAYLKRLRARAGAEIAQRFFAQGYIGGRTDRPSMKEWSPAAGSPDSDHLPQEETLRARSRDLTRNAPVATGAVNTAVTNTVGSGLKLQARIDRDLLGLEEEEADAWERRAERIWKLAARNIDIEGEQHFGAMQNLAFRSVLESGDLLYIRRFRARPGDILGTKVQFIEADRISNPHHRMDTDRLAGGVEIDADGRPTACHVANRHPGDLIMRFPTKWDRVPFHADSGARLAKLLFEKRRPGQRRGVPYLAPVIEPLKQLERYTHAELMAAVVSSMFTVFVKAEGDERTSGVGVIPGEDDPDDAGDLFLGSGLVMDLDPGESIEIADPMRPNEGFDQFVLAILRQVGSALEIPFELLIKHFSSSYSASRAALLEAWKFFRMRRDFLANDLCDQVYAWVMAEAIARGLIRAPGFFDDPQIRAAWLGAEWVGPAPGQVQPKDEVEAAKLRVDMGISTLQEETAQITGGDWERKHQQRVKEARMRREAGLDRESVSDVQVTRSTTEESEEDES